MRMILISCMLAVVSASSAFAIDKGVVRQLNSLAPADRLEQRCDIEAMDRINKEQSGYKPDRVVSYTFGFPDISENEVSAKGAAFRSKGDWFRLKYNCRVETSDLSIAEFDYKVGEIIPREEWRQYYLYN